MNRLDTLYGGARDLATVVSSNVKHAGKLLDAGAKIGALKGGAKVATVFAKRHPALLAASALGAGLLWYAAHRRAKRAENGNGAAIEGSARRVDARRGNGTKRAATKRTTRSRQSSATT